MNDLKDRRIFITGGAGFVGSTIADLLLDEYKVGQVVVLDDLRRGRISYIGKRINDGILFFEGDIRDKILLERVFETGIDYCFHMAAISLEECTQNSREAHEIMIDGMFDIAEACVEHKVKRLVIASSASIYGQAELLPTPERHHPYNNHSFYGAYKMMNELLLDSFYHTYGLSNSALRYFNIYGERMDAKGKYTNVILKWYKLIKEGKQPLIFGDGRQTMDMIHVRDVARATILAMKSDANEVFNIGSGHSISLKELCIDLLLAMESSLVPKHISMPEGRQKVEVYSRCADISKAEEILEFVPEVSLDEGLKKLIKWLDRRSYDTN